MKTNLIIFSSFIVGAISILLPPLWGLALALIYTMVHSAIGWRKSRLHFVAPVFVWVIITIGFLLPFKYEDQIISAPHQKSAKFRELYEIYSGAFFVFPEKMDYREIDLPQKSMTIGELRVYIESKTGMKSTAKACDWGCNILTGCTTGPIIFHEIGSS